jgi:glutamate carboxypeptidase
VPIASRATLCAAALAFAAGALAQPVEPVLTQARAHRQPLLDTLKSLVAIESGSDDREGLDRASELIAGELKALGGTDAAFAALATKNAVVERFGLQGFGAHSNEDEYILVSSIEPRLYLATRLIMDLSRDKVR